MITVTEHMLCTVEKRGPRNYWVKSHSGMILAYTSSRRDAERVARTLMRFARV